MDALGIGIVVVLVVACLMGLVTSRRNKDPEQLYLIAKILDEYQRFKKGKIDDDELNEALLKLLIGSKSPGHLVSMIRPYSAGQLPGREAQALYEICASLYRRYNL